MPCSLKIYRKGRIKMGKARILTVEELTAPCDPSLFTGEACNQPLEGFIGQDTALEALRFGLAIDADGYNIIIVNPSGSGKRSVLRQFIEKTIENGKPLTLHDYCYVFNFHDER